MRSFIGTSSRVGPPPVIAGGVLSQPPVDASAVEAPRRQPAQQRLNLLLMVADRAGVKDLLQPLGKSER
jgi:hypothetical protein